ncbi:MAG TPA: hypothetical protein PKD15_00800 [Candidatus Saccharibacteria bacterium]|nr:hypothetical protein [Candidatus Saccharibacteria bacterium]
MQITIQVKGDRAVQAKLRRLGQSVYQLKAAMNRIGQDASRYYSTRGFASQGGVFGKPWQPLSPITLLARGHNVEVENASAANFGGFLLGRRLQSGLDGNFGSNSIAPLVDSGKMQNSFEFEASSQSVLISNSATYFKYHQSTLPRKRLPRRATMGINEPIKRMIRMHINDEVRKKIMSV